MPDASSLSGFQAASVVKFALLHQRTRPSRARLLYTAFRRNIAARDQGGSRSGPVKFLIRNPETGGLLNIQGPIGFNPTGGCGPDECDQTMDQSREGALWTWQVDRPEQRRSLPGRRVGGES